jgi:hypothetical protein
MSRTSLTYLIAQKAEASGNTEIVSFAASDSLHLAHFETRILI